MGPTGTGKSTVAAQFVSAAAARGEAGIIFCFDESPTNLLVRTNNLGVRLEEHVEAGRVQLVPVDPAELSAGELAHRILLEVERGVRVVVIDSINGYVGAMADERFLPAHLRELLAYLSAQGVATLLTIAQQSFAGTGVKDSALHIEHIADTILLFRHFEMQGALKQALSVLKKRTGAHERTIRELELGSGGLHLGEPLTQMHGVLTGHPLPVDRALRGGEREPVE